MLGSFQNQVQRRLHRAGARACMGAVAFCAVGCQTAVDVQPDQKGGVNNPVRVYLPEGEIAYLERLRTPDGRKVRYSYVDAVLGPAGRVLDRYSLPNPAAGRAEGPIAELLQALRAKPGIPGAFRIYMDLYHRGKPDRTPPPGFRYDPLLEPGQKARDQSGTGDRSPTGAKSRTPEPNKQGPQTSKKE